LPAYRDPFITASARSSVPPITPIPGLIESMGSDLVQVNRGACAPPVPDPAPEGVPAGAAGAAGEARVQADNSAGAPVTTAPAARTRDSIVLRSITDEEESEGSRTLPG
jgi:hypothetical protein